MTGTNCDLFTHNQSQSHLNHLVFGTSVPSHYVVCLNNTSLVQTTQCWIISQSQTKGFKKKGCGLIRGNLLEAA